MEEKFKGITQQFRVVLEVNYGIKFTEDSFVFNKVICRFEWKEQDAKRYLLVAEFQSQESGNHMPYELTFDKNCEKYSQSMSERVKILLEKIVAFKEMFGLNLDN